jgi:hypothetical protein
MGRAPITSILSPSSLPVSTSILTVLPSLTHNTYFLSVDVTTADLGTVNASGLPFAKNITSAYIPGANNPSLLFGDIHLETQTLNLA